MSRSQIEAIRQILTFACIVMSYVFTQAQDRKPVWSDEFEYEGAPDISKWDFDLGDGCDIGKCGWGNKELQYYTSTRSNSRVEAGHLIIEARKENRNESRFTSARLVSKNKGDWKYGRIEVAAKVPVGRGTWSAIWMLPTIKDRKMDWPMDGEIDIMEHVGFDPGTVVGTIHTQAYNHTIGTHKNGNIILDDIDANFHTYAIEWTEDKIVWFVDDKRYFEFANENKGKEEWPFDIPFHLILNIAVGGNWGGQQGIDEDVWPEQMVVDYVRVYENK